MAQSNTKLTSIIAIVVAIIAAVAVTLYVIGQASRMGTPVVISGDERVSYSGTATEQEARALGAALTKADYFDGVGESDVLLKKAEEGTIISFVVSEEGWTNPAHLEEFKFLVDRVSHTVGGLPITLRLIDSSLNTKKEAKIETGVWGAPFEFTSLETVHYVGSATQEDAKKLAGALKEIGYFAGKKNLDVFIIRDAGQMTVAFVTNELGWTDATMEQNFREIGESIAPAIGGNPLTLRFVDEYVKTKKEIQLK